MLWGESPDASGEDEEMGHTILGDVNHPAPVIVSQPASNAGLVAALVLSSLLPTAGVAGLAAYLLTRQPQASEQWSADDETVSIGLGRIEDYLKD